MVETEGSCCGFDSGNGSMGFCFEKLKMAIAQYVKSVTYRFELNITDLTWIGKPRPYKVHQQA